MPARVLIVEDRDSLRRMLEKALAGEGYEVTAAADGASGIARLEAAAFDLVLTDLKLPDADGLAVLAAARRAQPATPVLVMTGYGTVAAAVEAMKLGALDFLEKPVELDDLFRRVADAVGGGADSAVSLEVEGAPPVVGRHPKLRAAVRLLERVAPTESTVLLTGESGTGKEVFARSLHRLSRRAGGPFVAVNCAAIPETLMENELFGHERGAFTGADRRRAGRFEAAAGGTLFLDEVGELAPGVQGKVLRILEERSFERVGSATTLAADVRLVAATNRPLEAMVAAGSFRADLYYRLAVFPIELPPLAERASDVPLLAAHLVGRAAERHGLAEPALTAAAADLLAAEDWPGNVRQLANVVERAVILSEGRPIDADDLAPLLRAPGSGGHREAVRQALIDADGDKQRAAEMLGISYRTLQRKVREHDLEGVPKYRS